MQAHQLLPSKKGSRRIGRGGKRGSFSGRGIKGQKARAGRRVRPQIRDILKKIHKRRGQGKNYSKSASAYRIKPRAINLVNLNRVFQNGEHITMQKIVNAGLAKSGEMIKILGGGAHAKKFTFDKELSLSKALQVKLGIAHDK